VGRTATGLAPHAVHCNPEPSCSCSTVPAAHLIVPPSPHQQLARSRVKSTHANEGCVMPSTLSRLHHCSNNTPEAAQSELSRHATQRKLSCRRHPTLGERVMREEEPEGSCRGRNPMLPAVDDCDHPSHSSTATPNRKTHTLMQPSVQSSRPAAPASTYAASGCAATISGSMSVPLLSTATAWRCTTLTILVPGARAALRAFSWSGVSVWRHTHGTCTGEHGRHQSGMQVRTRRFRKGMIACSLGRSTLLLSTMVGGGSEANRGCAGKQRQWQ
jgi:hypothetical protein